jgi:methionyl-tRNA formyltransferase
MLLVARTPIGPDDTGASVHDRLAVLGARAMVDAHGAHEAGTLVATPQPGEGVTYARKLAREDAALDWSLPAQRLVDRVRAFDPVPGATARLDDAAGTTIKVWRARVARGLGRAQAPGTVLEATGRLVVACGDGAVELMELQKPGGRRLRAEDFLRGFEIAAGARFSASAA